MSELSGFHQSLKTPIVRKTWQRYSLILVGCILFGLYRTLVNALHGYALRDTWFWRNNLVDQLASWFAWACIIPALCLMVRHFHFQSGKKIQSLFLYFGSCAVFSFFQVALWKSIEWKLAENRPFLDSLWGMLTQEIHPLTMTGWLNNLYYIALFIGGYVAMHFFRGHQIEQQRATEMEIKAKELEKQVVEAQFNALRMQLNPHFLFNTLNAIHVLVEEQPTLAKTMILRLSELLRSVLAESQDGWVPLEKELHFLTKYLEIEKVRFPEKLHWEIEQDIPLETNIPFLIMQPLVENAIKHGISKSKKAGKLAIHIGKQDEHIVMKVVDDGNRPTPSITCDANQPSHEVLGIGLSLTCKRLHELFGHDWSFRLSRDKGNTTATIMYPQGAL